MTLDEFNEGCGSGRCLIFTPEMPTKAGGCRCHRRVASTICMTTSRVKAAIIQLKELEMEPAEALTHMIEMQEEIRELAREQMAEVH